jgi:hypothetical protein
MNDMEQQPSIGEARVRVDFNTTDNSVVNELKLLAAQMINKISAIEDGTNRVDSKEVGRLKALAMTAIEEGAMWAVKAETSARL